MGNEAFGALKSYSINDNNSLFGVWTRCKNFAYLFHKGQWFIRSDSANFQI